MSILDNMPHRCTIQRLIHSQGSMAGSKSTPVVEQTGVKCWEQTAGNAEVLEYQKRGMLVTHKVYFVADPEVTERHQILITEREGVIVSSPLALDVRSEAKPNASVGLSFVWKVMCDRNTGGQD